MRRLLSICIPVILTLGVAVGAWRLLGRRPPEASWLQVEAPRQADAGTTFRVTVALKADAFTDDDEPVLVNVDLHGFTRHHDWRSSVASSPTQPISRPGEAREFDVPVPRRPDLRYVAILVYLSPTGRWRDHTAVASSLEIWYRPDPTGPPLTEPARIAMYPQMPGGPIERRDVRAVSILIALGWCFCAVQAWRASRAAENPRARRHRLIPLGAALAAGWELLPLEHALGVLARTIAYHLHLYNLRMGFQQFVTALIAAVAVGIVYRTLSRAETWSLRLQMSGLTLYAAVTLTGFLSLHLIDAVFAQRISGLPLLQWLQLAGMLTALTGTIARLRKSSPVANDTERGSFPTFLPDPLHERAEKPGRLPRDPE